MIRIVTIDLFFVPSGRVGEEKEATGKMILNNKLLRVFAFFFEQMCCVLVRL